ncbi:MAG: helix-turn-helix transcriptional regulator [Clostridia bacterium]|nr:helix-turn-helix transcriptional regulator [Clostridia bacterium]
MLVFDLKIIGNKIYEIRTKKLMSRAEVAEKANLSERTYADIERGSVNMRVETILKICTALSITPNDIFVLEENEKMTEETLVNIFKDISQKEKETALNLLEVYLKSLI